MKKKRLDKKINDQPNKKRELSTTQLMLTVAVVALVVRTIYFIGFTQNPYFNHVHWAHDSIVMHEGALLFTKGDLLLNKQGMKYPFYSYFVGCLYLLTNNAIPALWVAQFILGIIASVLMVLCGKRLFGSGVGLIAGLFYALYPQNVAFEGTMLREFLTEFLAILSFYLLLRFQERRSWPRLVLVAVTLSLMIQCRPNFVVIFPLIIIYLFVSVFQAERMLLRFGRIAVLCLVVVGIGLPLFIRGMYVETKFIFFDPAGPSVFLMGNLTDYDGWGWHGGSDRFRNLHQAYSHDVQNNYGWVLKTVGKEIFNEPLEYLLLYGRKIATFLNDAEIPDNTCFYLYQRFSFVLRNPIGHFSLVVALACIGIVITRKSWRTLLPLYVFIIGTAASTIVFYVTGRLRLPAVPFFMLFSSAGIMGLYILIQQKKILKAVGAAVTIIVIVYILRVPDDKETIRSNDLGMMADTFYTLKRFDEAIPFYKEAIKPDSPEGRLRLADCYLKIGAFREAATESAYLLNRQPNDGNANYILSIAYYYSHNISLAQQYCIRARQLGISIPPDYLAALGLQ